MSWSETLMDVLRLTAEVKRQNEELRDLSTNIRDIDKRVVRLETMVEMAQYQKLPKN